LTAFDKRDKIKNLENSPTTFPDNKKLEITDTMTKSLEKTIKKIGKKKANINALHENSRGTA
jgi:hypothetical protein